MAVKNRKYRILLVDDDPFVRMMLKEILEFGGYSVEVAVSGPDALEKFSLYPETALIISDMNMAEMNGIEFIREFRKQNRDIPIIILTVNTEITVALKAIRCGANDYLLKDDNIQDTLLISIEKNLEKSRLEKQNRKLLEELARKNRELERLSLLDGLTDVPNRRYFDKVIFQECLRAARESKPVSMLMIDIDFFKNYNDSCGHPAGDDCLRKVAKSLEYTLSRPGDFLARFGGEEFAAILPDTDSRGALLLAEKMLAGIRELKIAHPSSAVSGFVSISLGIGSIPPAAGLRADPARLIAMADQALYRAKSSGRNCIGIMEKAKTGSC